MATLSLDNVVETETITAKIAERTYNRIRGLVVRLEGESVILEGRCHSQHTKQLAQEAVLQHTHRIIINNIIVGF